MKYYKLFHSFYNIFMICLGVIFIVLNCGWSGITVPLACLLLPPAISMRFCFSQCFSLHVRCQHVFLKKWTRNYCYQSFVSGTFYTRHYSLIWSKYCYYKELRKFLRRLKCPVTTGDPSRVEKINILNFYIKKNNTLSQSQRKDQYI